MNVLFLALSYSTATHKSSYEDLLRVFQSNGHMVYVACANEKGSKERDGLSVDKGISVLRIRTGNLTGDIGIFKKGISTLTIDGIFLRAIRKHYQGIQFDLIIYPTPPITLVNTITSLKKNCGAKTYLLLKDIFPQNAVDLGMMSKEGIRGLIYKMFRKKEKKLYRVSDFIGCMSPANVKYVLDHNLDVHPEKVEVCPNCILLPENAPSEHAKYSINIRHKYNIPENTLLFLYGGNLGKPQGINFLIQCLLREKNNKKAFFIIIGSGTEYESIKAAISENHITNSLLLDYLPKDEYQIIANQCQVGMIFLDYRFTIPNFPSRSLSYMKAAMPLLVVTDPICDMGTIAEQYGFGVRCLSNNVEDFAEAVEKFINADITEMGKHSWAFLKENYTVQNGYSIIMKHFE